MASFGYCQKHHCHYIGQCKKCHPSKGHRSAGFSRAKFSTRRTFKFGLPNGVIELSERAPLGTSPFDHICSCGYMTAATFCPQCGREWKGDRHVQP